MIVDTVPRLVKGKPALIALFQGAGVSESILAPLRSIVRTNPDSIKKFEIARRIVHAMNAQGEHGLRARRELVKRIVEFTAFDQCYPNDAMAARGGVAAVSQFVNLKDSVTRTVDAERQHRERAMKEAAKRTEDIRLKREQRDSILSELSRLFSDTNPVARGKSLEALMNRLFVSEGISVREPFRIVSCDGNGVVEQIDGVIEFDGHHYLVEIKWWAEPLGVGDVSQHMVRVFQRGQSRGLFIVHPGYTAPAIESVQRSLQQSPFVLAVLEELVHVLRTDSSVSDWLRSKVTAAMAERNPFKKFSG